MIFEIDALPPVTRKPVKPGITERIAPPPHRLPQCDAHPTWDFECRRCIEVLAIRERIVADSHRRHIARIARTSRFGN